MSKRASGISRPRTRATPLPEVDEAEHLISFLTLPDVGVRVAETFPALERVSCYATPINLMHKPIVELCSPRAKKLLLVYQMVRGRIYLTKPQFERLLASAQQPSQARQPCRVYCD